MKKIVLTVVAMLSMTLAFADGEKSNMSNEAKVYDMSVNYRKLAICLGLDFDQMDAVEMIRREACDGLSAADLAARFPFTRRLFDMRFREAVGRSPLDEILHVRLEKAQALLSGTDTPVMALPDFCGFSSDRALDNLFRTRYGIRRNQILG